ncbi:chemotaxis protein methyltransferase CheR [Rhizobium aquaticum]|uniref:Chemotaxis protein methyltransferase n=1 Tax=Rhizobium aquaticum TaxID=1549636 RepID=A0ABV2J4H2_9HYPH
MSVAEARDQFDAGGISPKNFERLSRYIYDYSGIKMPPAKKTMLEGRLRRRLRATDIETFDEYCDYLFRQDGLEREAIHLMDAVTTNKTDFFREPKHFEHMFEKALPTLVADGHRRLRIWSAAASIGAEAYTIAMVMEEFLRTHNSLDYNILATDLSTEVLKIARRGVYPKSMITPVEGSLRKRYVMEARDQERDEVRIHPRLRSKVGFARLNLMDEKYEIGDKTQIVFCRNVLIYFDKPTQQKVLKRLCDNLISGGFLYVGHSETITGLDLPVKQVANTVFRRV